MEKKVLMLYPEYPVTFWSYKHVLKYISKKAAFPPLGLLTVASMLPKDWNVRLIDLNTDRVNEKDYEWADYVMISAMMIQRKSARNILESCLKHGKKTIAGGPLFNLETEDYVYLVDHLTWKKAKPENLCFRTISLSESNSRPILGSDRLQKIRHSGAPVFQGMPARL